MHFLLLVIICSTSIALILKYNDSRKGELIVLLAGNYLVAASIALILLVLNHSKLFSYQTLLYGAGLGSLFVITFLLLSFAISHAGMGLAITSSRLSVIIPIILSIIFFNESPTKLHIFGFLFTILTFVMFYFSVKSGHKDGDGMLKYILLIAVFIGIGINDFALKYFKVWRSELEEPYFIFFIFSSAFIYSSFYIILKKIKIKPQTAMLGLVLGIPNVLATTFLLSALALFPAILVFPLMNVGIILSTTLMAFLIWKEKLNRWGILALVSGLLAILFLSIGSK
jgi:drug/metabolite transporter (DMT)-like permease